MKKLVTLLILLLLPIICFAQDAREIVLKSLSLSVPTTSRAEQIISNVDKKGNIDLYDMIQYRYVENGLTKSIYIMKKPILMNGIVMLQIEKQPKDFDVYTFVPILKMVRRMPKPVKTDSFNGFEFTLNDLIPRDVDDDTHNFCDEQDDNLYVIKSIPNSTIDLEYDYRIQYIDKHNFLQTKVDYFKNGKQIKQHCVQSVKELKSSKYADKTYILREKCFYKNYKTGRTSHIEIQYPSFDIELNPLDFNSSRLEKWKN